MTIIEWLVATFALLIIILAFGYLFKKDILCMVWGHDWHYSPKKGFGHHEGYDDVEFCAGCGKIRDDGKEKNLYCRILDHEWHYSGKKGDVFYKDGYDDVYYCARCGLVKEDFDDSVVVVNEQV